MKNESPIGFFDSGIGGITVLKEAYISMPNENYIYFGDNKNAPYGKKTEQEIQDLTLACGEVLFKKGVKAIVMACNTATSTAVYMMREKYKIPVISMEPAVKPAVNALRNGRILVLATPVTVNQQRYKNLVSRMGCGDSIISVGLNGMVELIERGDFSSYEIDEYLDRRLSCYKGREIDAIVLGCTHYSLIRIKIENFADRFFKGKTEIFDGNAGTVRQLKRVLAENNMLSESKEKGGVVFYSSSGKDTIPFFKRVFKEF